MISERYRKDISPTFHIAIFLLTLPIVGARPSVGSSLSTTASKSGALARRNTLLTGALLWGQKCLNLYHLNTQRADISGISFIGNVIFGETLVNLYLSKIEFIDVELCVPRLSNV